MDRKLYQKLLEWKCSPMRKPLILNGARQVGKTWLLKEFGKKEYKNYLYLNCDHDSIAQEIFNDYNVARILRLLEGHCGTKVEPKETLVILDELQAAPRGLGALKYFCEDAPEIHVAVAASLLGLGMHAGTSYPVGKADELTLRPLDYQEFLGGIGDLGLLEILKTNDWCTIDALRQDFIERLRYYYYIGGMPEAVADFARTGSILNTRSIQKKILTQYDADMSKHAPDREVPRISLVWNSMVSQLAKENKKFIYGALAKGGRARDFELAIQWLIDAGLVHRISRAAKIAAPLKFYEDPFAFKLFPLDCGLMGAMAETRSDDVLAGDRGFAEYKGAFSEAFVLQELKASLDGSIMYYSSNDSNVEIDFMFDLAGKLVPLEVKASENLQSKSLRTAVGTNPGLKGLRCSLSPYREQEWMENVPIYGLSSYVDRALKMERQNAGEKIAPFIRPS